MNLKQVTMVAIRTFRGADGYFHRGDRLTVNEGLAVRYEQKRLARRIKPAGPSETKPAQPEETKSEQSIEPLGAGWFELPDGRKVRGKDAALKALNESEG